MPSNLTFALPTFIIQFNIVVPGQPQLLLNQDYQTSHVSITYFFYDNALMFENNRAMISDSAKSP